MSPRDDDEYDEKETVTRRLGDQDVEAILSGDALQATPDIGALALLVAELRASSSATVADDLAAVHVAAAAATARSVATTPAPAATAQRRRRRLGVLAKGTLSGLTAKILLGTAVALAATGGAAAAGILPAPIQDVVSRGAGVVGIDIPRAHHSDEHTSTTTTLEVTTTTVDSVDPTISGGSTTTGATSNDAATTPGALAGSYEWTGTFCDGSGASVTYSVDADGSLHLVATNGDVTTQSGDRLEVRFADTVRVGIRLEEHDHVWTIETSEQRACGQDVQGNEGGDNQGGDDQGTDGGGDESTESGSGGDQGGGSGGDQGDGEGGDQGSGGDQGPGGDQGSGDGD